MNKLTVTKTSRLQSMPYSIKFQKTSIHIQQI